MPKQPSKPKHIPYRTCVGCREVEPKRSLIRIVRGPNGVEVDPSGKKPGRGAYLHDQKSCWESALKGSLAKALRVQLTAEEQERLLAFARTLQTEKTG